MASISTIVVTSATFVEIRAISLEVALLLADETSALSQLG
jgi:hypothetical protein